MTPEEFAASVVEMTAVRPGDSLLLRMKDGRAEDLRRAADEFRQWLPDNVRVVVVTEAIEITVLRTGE